MMGCGLLAAAVLTLPGVPASVCAVLLVQGQLLLDCVDGELARVRGRTGPMGVYLDRVGHFSTEAALAAAIGLRADGGWQSIGGWTTVGLSVAVLVLLIKAETELVHVARHHAGLPPLPDSAERIMPAGLLSLRRIADVVPIHRALLALEVSVLALLAALVDAAATSLVGTRTLLLVLLGVAVLVVTGHLVTIVTSPKLR
jgi:phosphatidylglycerophosphate synthase